MQRLTGFQRAAWGALLLSVLTGASASAATVSVSSVEVRAGDTGVAISFSLTVQPGEQVSGSQFDLVFPAAALQLTHMAPGPAATAADKSVAISETAPGRVRILVAGLNQNVMASGVVVEGFFNVPARAPNGRHSLALEGLVLSNPAGRAVPATAEPGAVTVSGGSDPTPVGCGCGALGPTQRENSWPSVLPLMALAALLYAWGKRAARSTKSACSRA